MDPGMKRVAEEMAHAEAAKKAKVELIHSPFPLPPQQMQAPPPPPPPLLAAVQVHTQHHHHHQAALHAQHAAMQVAHKAAQQHAVQQHLAQQHFVQHHSAHLQQQQVAALHHTHHHHHQMQQQRAQAIQGDLDAFWSRNLTALAQYKAEHHGREPPASFVLHVGDGNDDLRLGRWCDRQRTAHKNGKLSAAQIQELSEIGFEWDPLDASWTRHIAALRRYKLDNNGRDPPQTCQVPGAGKGQVLQLGFWCFNRKQAKKQGKLKPEKIAELDALGFDWEPHESFWHRNILALKKYKADNKGRDPPGGYMIPNGDRGNTLRLGSWCANQRVSKRKGNLHPDKIAELTALNFEWEPVEAEFVRCIHALKQYKHDNQNRDPLPRCIVPGPEPGQQIKLGKWCQKQRAAQEAGTLPEEKVMQLTLLDFEWTPDSAEWDRNISLLKEFQQNHEGRGCGRRYVVPKGNRGSDAKLGDWCHRLRKERLKNKLLADKVAELDAINFEWDLDAICWNRAISLLRSYRQQNGGNDPPASSMILGGDKGDDVLYWVWARAQKKLRKKDKLTLIQIAELDSLGFNWL